MRRRGLRGVSGPRDPVRKLGACPAVGRLGKYSTIGRKPLRRPRELPRSLHRARDFRPVHGKSGRHRAARRENRPGAKPWPAPVKPAAFWRGLSMCRLSQPDRHAAADLQPRRTGTDASRYPAGMLAAAATRASEQVRGWAARSAAIRIASVVGRFRGCARRSTAPICCIDACSRTFSPLQGVDFDGSGQHPVRASPHRTMSRRLFAAAGLALATGSTSPDTDIINRSTPT